MADRSATVALNRQLGARAIRTVAIIQARHGASRFPGKIWAPLAGRPIVSWVTRAAQSAHGVDHVVLATSDLPADDRFEDWAASEGVELVRGSEDDVLARFALAARQSNADRILRLTADCPLLDPAVIEQCLLLMERAETPCSYATNTLPPSWPDGLDCEVFTRAALEEANAEARTAQEREHVTPYLRRHSDRFGAQNLTAPIPGLAAERWTVDYPSDLAYLERVLAPVGDAGPYSYSALLQLISAAGPRRPEELDGARNEALCEAPPDTLPRQSFQRGQAQLARALERVPTGTQTFSKSADQFPKGVAPLFAARGEGATLFDLDGNPFVDLMAGLLPIVLGYADPAVDTAIRAQLDRGISFSLATTLEAELAERLAQTIPCAEMTRYAKNGSDATSACVRVARAATGRDRVLACGYHGWQDWYIGTTTRRLGVPRAVQDLTSIVPYGDLDAVEDAFKANPDKIAGVILEPMNVAFPPEGYLQSLREICHAHGALLIFDEVITGFRFQRGGAQSLFGVTPDLAAFGKALGNGMPISAICGAAKYMRLFEDVFVSGTFGGEALSLAAALAVLRIQAENPVIETLATTGTRLGNAAMAAVEANGLSNCVALTGHPSWQIFQFEDVGSVSADAIRTFFIKSMLSQGVLIQSAQNVMYALTETDKCRVEEAYRTTFVALADALNDGNFHAKLGVAPIEGVFRVRE